MSASFTIVEIEYSGIRYRKNYVIEVAMVRLDENGNRQSLHKIIKPDDGELPDFIWALVTFSKDAMTQALTFAEVSEEIAAFCANSVLVGINIRYTYSLLKRAFKNAGLRFVHKHICLSKLLNEAFAHHKTTTVGSLCNKLSINFSSQFTLPQRALCMSYLFERLFVGRLGNKSAGKSLIHQTSLNAKLPPHLPFTKVENLPNAMGVYYFLDHKGKIVYLGKSNDIKKRVLTHFNSDLNEFKKWEMKNAIYDVQYRLTGSELVALLLESDEIKRYMPPYNRAQRRVKYTQGIYINLHPSGFLHFTITTLGNAEGLLLTKFSNKWRAIRFILHAALQFGLNPQYCGLSAYQHLLETQPDMPEPQSAEQHNESAQKLIAHYSYPQPNLIILDQGRTPDEVSAVLIQNNLYCGYAYLPNENTQHAHSMPDAVREYLIPMRDNPDVQSIIRNYLQKNTQQVHLLPF